MFSFKTIFRKKQMNYGLFRAISEADLAVYLDNRLSPTIKAEEGKYPAKVAIVSVPKAGTYLIGKLLSLLGFVDTEIHVRQNAFTDYRQRNVDQKRNNSDEYLIEIPLNLTVELIKNGQFIVGHLPKTRYVENCLVSFKKIFVYRDLRDSVVSYMRFMASTTRGNDRNKAWKNMAEGPDKLLTYFRQYLKKYLAQVEPITIWIEDKNVLPVAYEQICGDYGQEKQIETLSAIASHLEVSEPADYKDILGERLFAAETLTWSGKRTDRSKYWNNEVEQVFDALGGNRLNKKLGYDY